MHSRRRANRLDSEADGPADADHRLPLRSQVNELRPSRPSGLRVETPAFDVDASAPPLVITTIRAVDSVDDVLELERAFVRVYERRARQVFITEIGSANRIDRRIRHASAEMARRLEPFDIAWSLGAAVIVASPMLRATIVALKWIAKPTIPESYVATREEAVVVTEQRMRDAGLVIDDAVRAKLAEFVARSS